MLPPLFSLTFAFRRFAALKFRIDVDALEFVRTFVMLFLLYVALQCMQTVVTQRVLAHVCDLCRVEVRRWVKAQRAFRLEVVDLEVGSVAWAGGTTC